VKGTLRAAANLFENRRIGFLGELPEGTLDGARDRRPTNAARRRTVSNRAAAFDRADVLQRSGFVRLKHFASTPH